MSYFDDVLSKMSRPASNISNLNGTNDTIKIAYSVFVDLNKKIEPIMRENERDRENGLAAMQGLIIG